VLTGITGGNAYPFPDRCPVPTVLRYGALMNILCVTPNVSMDRILSVSGFAAGDVCRARSVAVTCGGKGINVARAVRRLGHRSTCAGFLGGNTGRLAAEAVRLEGLDATWTWVDGETRNCITIVSDNGETTVVNEPGASVTDDDWYRLAASVAEAVNCADAVCISGSLPPGVPDGGLEQLIEAAKDSRKPVWVDTSGDALADAIGARPTGIKINAAEASWLMGEKVNSIAQCIVIAEKIRNNGVEKMVVTQAAEGAVMVCNEGTWCARPPTISVVSAVGSGDCFLAGLMVGMLQEQEPAEALRLAAAAGAANALQVSTGEIDRVDLEHIHAKIRIEAVSS